MEVLLRLTRFLLIGYCFLSYSLSLKAQIGSHQTEAVNGAEAFTMLDLHSLDDAAREWCYSSKSTTVIGIPFMTRPVQVTFDGAIFTRDAELCFFYGDSLQPLMARQKTYLEGWIPVIGYDWQYYGVQYAIEMFAAAVDGIGTSNTIQFVQLKATNISKKTRRARFAAASRFTGGDHRYGGLLSKCLPNTRFEMNDGCLFRDDLLLYTYAGLSELLSTPGSPYKTPFLASDYSIHENTATGLSITNKLLAPGESIRQVFKMPNYPVSKKEMGTIQLIQKANYGEYLEKTVQYWKKLVEGATTFSIPEKRVNDSYKAGLVHLMLATRQDRDGKNRQGSGLPYDELFFNDYVDMRRIYDLSGHPEFVDINVQWLMDSQNKDGMFLDPVLTHGQEIMASHGQALVSVANHYSITRDTLYAKKVYSTIKRAVNWMYRKHKDDVHGLMPPSIPFDAEMIKGYYTSHNLWCLLALRDAIRVAKSLGNEEDVREWTLFHESYKKAVLQAIVLTTGTPAYNGYVPTGLYEFITGPAAREGFREHQTNQDWENNLLIYPTEVLEANDSRIQATLDTIRKKKYREGIMTYRNGMHLHQYATVNQAHQYLAINDQKHALSDLYHILLHNGSTHEGFENMTEPWEDMDAWPIPPPHAWAAAKTSLLIRNMMIREYGGEAGMIDKERDLYLFSIVSPSWVKDGKSIIIKNAVTEMGSLSAEMNFRSKGAHISIESKLHTNPASIVIAIPYFAKIESYKSDAISSREKNGYLVFSPEVTSIDLVWKINKNKIKNAFEDILLGYRRENSLKWRELTEAVIIKGGEGFLLKNEKNYSNASLSFDLVKKAFIQEYTRRLGDYTRAGKKPMPVKPPPLVPLKIYKE